jgi:hypothetical protein
VVTVITIASAPASSAHSPDHGNLVGGWRIAIEPGTPDEHFAVLLVNQGGTASVRVEDGDGAVGVWRKVPGPGNYALTLDEFDDTNEDGTPERYRVRIAAKLSHDTLTGTITVEETTPDGSVVIEFEGQASFAGTRMHVE